MSEEVMKGSCLCSHAQYTIAAAPIFSAKCYCKDCQKESGTGHATAVAVPEAALSVDGSTRDFSKQADSGAEVIRTFCPNCGTTLFVRSSNTPGMVIVRAGTLDDSSDLSISMAVFCCSQQAWDAPPEGVTKFERMPPRG